MDENSTQAREQTVLSAATVADAVVDRLLTRTQVNAGIGRFQKSEPDLDPAIIENIAMVCHEANGYYCAYFTGEEQPGWHYAPEWQRDSARSGVRKHLTQGHMDPEASHNSWMTDKLRDGWRYGEVKDAELKTHPCLLPYGELPLEQQLKDHLFGSIVRALAPLALGGDPRYATLQGARFQRG